MGAKHVFFMPLYLVVACMSTAAAGQIVHQTVFFNKRIDVVQTGDDETVTMIDFPQMVSVSHRNAQMYFDRDIGCIYRFFNKRFNLTEKGGQDGSEIDDDDSGRPSFLSIQNTSGALDKELAASGFAKKRASRDRKVH